MLSNPPRLCEFPEDDAERIVMLQGVLHRYSDMLLAYLKREMSFELRRFVEPQDVLQDTYFEAFQRSSEFQWQGEKAAFEWLVQIARHRMAAIVRMQKAGIRGGGRPDAGEFNRVVGMLDGLAVYSRTPSQSAMSHEVAGVVQRTIEDLEPQYREVIQFRFIEGLSVKETASRMKRSEGAVLMLSRRGLEALKELLQAASLPV
jgi:RNA polymerase sigma-70 factor, ECF subfamily